MILVQKLREMGYMRAAGMWSCVDDPDKYFEDLSDETVCEIGETSYYVTKEMLQGFVKEYAEYREISTRKVRAIIKAGIHTTGIADFLDFYGVFLLEKVVETSFGQGDILAVACF